MSAPVRAWVQKFDAFTVRKLERAIERATREGQEILPVYVSSFGGTVCHAFAMIDLMDNASVTCATIAVGMAESCGAVLLACGAKGHRWAGTQTEIMVHPILASTEYISAPEFANYAKATDAVNAQFLGLLDERSERRRGFWKRYVEKDAHRDHYMRAPEAKRLGLVDHIGVPRLSWAASLESGKAAR